MFRSVIYIGCIFTWLKPYKLALHIPLNPELVISSPLLPSGNTTILVNASTVPDFPASIPGFSAGPNAPAPTCDGDLLGYGLNKYSCAEARSEIPVDNRLLTFGDRSNKTYDVRLPRRFSGRESFAFFGRQKRTSPVYCYRTDSDSN